MKIILILLLCISLNAKSFMLSNIALPHVSILNLNTQEFDKSDYAKLYKEGFILTLLAQKEHDALMSELLYAHKQILNVQEIKESKLYQIAFFMPKKEIGRYATSTVNSAITTMLTNNMEFEITVFDAATEPTALQNIQNRRYDIVIAPVTNDIAQTLCDTKLQNKFYIPTLHSQNLECDNAKIIFGGIDYKKQVQSFEKEVAQDKITLISSDSAVIAQIDGFVKESYEVKRHIKIDNASNLKNLLKRYENQLHEQKVFINLPLVSATMFLSQMTLYDIEPKQIYTTQILYNPNILRLTQHKDRENLLIANSIKKLDSRDVGNANLLKNDLRYDWIDFTTTYGLSKILEGSIDDNQIEYDIHHIKAAKRNFVTKEIE
ncbi:MAG: hypothetical protein ACQESH_07150 [Campylobacterota bacterium]